MTVQPDHTVEFDPIAQRQSDIQAYTDAINLYTAVAAQTPSEWPEHLVQYKNRRDTHVAALEMDSLADVELAAQLWAHDQAQATVRGSMVERAKAQAVLNAMQAQQ